MSVSFGTELEERSLWQEWERNRDQGLALSCWFRWGSQTCHDLSFSGAQNTWPKTKGMWIITPHPKDVHALIPEPVTVIPSKAKGTTQTWLSDGSWDGERSWLIGAVWMHSQHRYNRSTEAKRRRQDSGHVWVPCLLALELPWTKEHRKLLEGGKSKGTHSSLQPAAGSAPQWDRPVSDLWLVEG